MKPYYEDELVTLYHGDCRDVLPKFLDDAAQLILADPPYGIGKADWDDRFHSDWMAEAGRVAPVLGLMPGTWNILACPREAGRLRYRWTLAAHLVNGMTRGAAGYSNWIPCLVYSGPDPAAWCADFAGWCDKEGITSSDLHRAAGVADGGGGMASHWKASQIPTPEQWEKLFLAFAAPWRFRAGVNAAARVYRQASDAQRVVVGCDDKPDHPSPKPLGVMRWLVDRLSFEGDLIVDPFAGSGSTLIAARELGRRVIGVEVEERYCELIVRRLSQGVLVFGSGVA